MAKMFYSMEEVIEKLGCSEADITQLTKEGLLREFHDGAKLIFKASDVENIDKSMLQGGGQGDQIPLSDLSNESGEIGLLPSDSTDQIGLSPSETGSQIGLLPEDSADQIGLSPSETGSQIGLIPGDSADQISLDDSTPAGGDDKDDTVVTNHGVNVMDESDAEMELVDPLAQTQIAPDMDQIDLDSGSSGSGLLDLSREADDTSLGAELLEEIYPGSDEHAVETQIPSQFDVPGTATASAAAETMEAEAVAAPETIKMVQVVDPKSGAFGAALIVPLVMLVLLGFTASAAISNLMPKLVASIAEYNLWVTVGAAVLAAIFFGVAMLSLGGGGSSSRPKAAKKVKEAKPKKEKKKKKK